MSGRAAAERSQETGHTRRKDRADRATTETVLDPRTWTILGKLHNAEAFARLHGCISTGKEANVYAATSREGADLAVKVYKTSILVFKDRDRSALAASRTVLKHTGSKGAPALQVCIRGLPLPQGLLAQQPSQDGQDVGREGDAQPGQDQPSRPAVPHAPGHQGPRAGHGARGHSRQGCAQAQGRPAGGRGLAAHVRAGSGPRAQAVPGVSPGARRPERVQPAGA